MFWTEEINHFLFIYDFMMELKVDKTRKDGMNGIKIGDRCCTACNNKGKKIPKKDILKIEFVDKI